MNKEQLHQTISNFKDNSFLYLVDIVITHLKMFFIYNVVVSEIKTPITKI